MPEERTEHRNGGQGAEAMPKKFDRELAELKEKVVSMGGVAMEMFQLVMRALVDRDRALLASLAAMEEEVDRCQIDIDDSAVRLMAVYGPVAFDLRFVMMVARVNTELERIGDQACNMCHHIELLLSEPELKKLIDLPRMAETAARMVKQSMRALKLGSTDLAREVIDADNTVDALNDQIFRELLTYMMSDPSTIPRAVALLFTARALERIADHATNIAEEVVYVVKGEDIRHEELQQVKDRAHSEDTGSRQ